MGRTGTAFVDSLRSKVDGKSIGAYPVDYPASWNFSKSASAGARDAGDRVAYMATNCPDTKMVLGGVSQGAGVIDLMTMGASSIGKFRSVPMPERLADHVAALAVFGNPSRNLAGGGPLSEISPLYSAKSIDLCAENDPFCSDGKNFLAHLSYVKNGMVDQAASFAASRL